VLKLQLKKGEQVEKDTRGKREEKRKKKHRNKNQTGYPN
jgi:hypothetical protein